MLSINLAIPLAAFGARSDHRCFILHETLLVQVGTGRPPCHYHRLGGIWLSTLGHREEYGSECT
jgi:hypothetical protein